MKDNFIPAGGSNASPDHLTDAEILAQARAMRKAGDVAGLLYLNTVLLVAIGGASGRLYLTREIGVAGV